MPGLRGAGHGQLLMSPKNVRLRRVAAQESSFDHSIWSEFVIAFLLAVIILSDTLVEARPSGFSSDFSFPSFTPQNKENLLQAGDTNFNQNDSSYDMNVGTWTGLQSASCSRLMYKDTVRMVDKESGTVASFSTSFTFSFTSKEPFPNSCGDGLVFTFGAAADISPTEYQLLESEFCLIDFFHHNSTAGVFGVEFDSYNNGPSCYDTSDGHIGVDLNNTSLATFNLCGTGEESQCFYFCGDKGNFTAWIDYDSAEEKLEVRFKNGSSGTGRPPNATFAVPNLRLHEFLDDYMYVGFSASTGQAQELHKIRSWEFSSTMQSPSVDNSTVVKSSSSVRPKLIAGIIAALVGALTLTFLYYFGFKQYWRRGSLKKAHGEERHEGQLSPLDLIQDSRAFTYRELKRITKNFSADCLLSSGGYGDVYKGTLPSGDLVAVKRFKPNVEQGQESFLTEASSLRQIRHRNLLRLKGWCQEREGLLIVYEYMSNGSLDKWLHHKPHYDSTINTEILSWNSRRFILTGVAAGLAYLHEEWTQCVLHRDVKSSNVMLDEEFNACLGDFGLARMVDHRKLEKTTLLAGTLGYMAPDMQYTGRATKESDVYAFGILVLEVMCGKPPLDLDAVDPRQFVLLDFVWHAQEKGNLASVADPKLRKAQRASAEAAATSSKEDDETKSVTQILQLGLLCCLPHPSERPSMRLVGQWLRASESGGLQLPVLPAEKPFYAYRTFTPSCLPTPVVSVLGANSREFTSSNDSIMAAAPVSPQVLR